MILSVDEVKAYLRIETDDEDDMVTTLIKQAQAAGEDYCRITFEGTGSPFTAVPEPVKQAVMLYVSHYYENRDIAERGVYNAMMAAFRNLLYPYRDVEKMF